MKGKYANKTANRASIAETELQKAQSRIERAEKDAAEQAERARKVLHELQRLRCDIAPQIEAAARTLYETRMEADCSERVASALREQAERHGQVVAEFLRSPAVRFNQDTMFKSLGSLFSALGVPDLAGNLIGGGTGNRAARRRTAKQSRVLQEYMNGASWQKGLGEVNR
jgi:hypothetical protein